MSRIISRLFIFLTVFIPIFYGCGYNHGFLELPFELPFSKQGLSTFGIMLALAFLTGNFFLQKEFKRLNLSPKIADNLIIGAIISGIIGAKLFYVWEAKANWHNWSQFSAHLFSGGGLTFLGGVVLGVLTVMLIFRHYKIPMLKGLDIATPSLAIGHGVGRIACFVSGDGCYGTKCDIDWIPAPFAMNFSWGAENWNAVVSKLGGDTNMVVFNTPLYTTIFMLIVFWFLWSVRKKEWPDGSKFFLFFIIYGIWRFLIEFIRRNPHDVFFGLFTQAQFVSIWMVLAGLVFFTYVKFFKKKTT